MEPLYIEENYYVALNAPKIFPLQKKISSPFNTPGLLPSYFNESVVFVHDNNTNRFADGYYFEHSGKYFIEMMAPDISNITYSLNTNEKWCSNSDEVLEPSANIDIYVPYDPKTNHDVALNLLFYLDYAKLNHLPANVFTRFARNKPGAQLSKEITDKIKSHYGGKRRTRRRTRKRK